MLCALAYYKSSASLISRSPSVRRRRLALALYISLVCAPAAAALEIASMEKEVAKTVKDVSPHDFVKAYSAHLKRSGKVSFVFCTNLMLACVLVSLDIIFLFADLFVLLLGVIALQFQ